MILEEFTVKNTTAKLAEGSVSWASPSNIALVKYWGKKKVQIPKNPSISFTLSQCRTLTELYFVDKKSQNVFDFEVFLDDELKKDFHPKIETFFNRIVEYCPFLTHYTFTIKTSNTFPHSSGIASSASGMSALALCIMSLEKQLYPNITDAYFYKKASFLARLGSGSACRSIKGRLVVWGEHPEIAESSNMFGITYQDEVHEVFANYQDTILLVDKGEKQVSSTVGHNLMHNHPFAESRFEQANKNMSKLKQVLKLGNLKAFNALVESEALTLHAMMMTSEPYFILMKPNTLEIINRIWNFREKTGLHIGFTLDAGANIHVLYPENEKKPILDFISKELVVYCQNGQYICDQVGFGAQRLKPNSP